MPGVERLATVIDSILHEHYLRRVTAAPWLEVGAMLAAALVLGFAVSRLSLAGASVVAVVLVAAFATSAQVALARYGLWQATAVPIVALMATFLALSLYRHRLLAKERRHIRRVFQRYLAPQMVDRLVSTQGLPALGGELRELTILFCDLRGFTALSERLAPDVLARVANDFLSAASEAIHEYGGTVDKYIGDAIMAFWNAPLDQPEHAALACRAGLRIQEKVRALEESWVATPAHRASQSVWASIRGNARSEISDRPVASIIRPSGMRSMSPHGSRAKRRLTATASCSDPKPRPA